jgi:murein DD-endopeptidase MepM/ murein hydrolase activator NlpD
MSAPRFFIILVAGLVLLVTASCGLASGILSQAAPNAADIQSPEQTATTNSPDSSPSLNETQTPAITTESSSSQALEEDPCAKEVCFEEGSFLLGRPIGPEGREAIDHSSRFGTLRKRVRDVYHGVQFLNSMGTPILAAADGDVVVAGDDSQSSYGPRPNMYGKLVILKHSLPGISEPVYTLYAHLSEVSVKVEGDVQAGEQIGLVGMSGSVRGSTLYFEVRVGENSYDATRNPELWLKPLLAETDQPTGTLAGRVMNAQGDYVSISNILVENIRAKDQEEIRQIYIRTYLDPNLRGRDPWNESFTASNLPEGTYRISFWFGPKRYQREVEVQPDMLTFVTFEVK